MNNDMIMAAVQEELKDFAKQMSDTVAHKIAMQELVLDKLMLAVNSLDARITQLEGPPLRDPETEGREL